MYINIGKLLRFPLLLIAVIILGFGIYQFFQSGFTGTINQQIAATLVSIFGLQLLWFALWLAKK